MKSRTTRSNTLRQQGRAVPEDVSPHHFDHIRSGIPTCPA
jgi:hypothetical protein